MKDIEMRSTDCKFRLVIDGHLFQTVLDACETSLNETGGILVGRYTSLTSSNDCAVVTRIGTAPNDSVCTPFTFQRGTLEVQEWIDQLWMDGKQHYLGEWHYHLGGSAIPSSIDDEQMKRFSSDKALCCPEPILLIVARNRKYVVKAFVYSGGKRIPLQKVKT